jgi:hypothetical protein
LASFYRGIDQGRGDDRGLCLDGLEKNNACDEKKQGENASSHGTSLVVAVVRQSTMSEKARQLWRVQKRNVNNYLKNYN